MLLQHNKELLYATVQPAALQTVHDTRFRRFGGGGEDIQRLRLTATHGYQLGDQDMHGRPHLRTDVGSP